MENFESIATIVNHFQIKKSSLELYGIDSTSFEDYIQVAHIPNSKLYSTMPVLVDSLGNKHSYNDCKSTTILKFNNSSSPPHSSHNSEQIQFENDYAASNSTALSAYSQSRHFSSQVILESEVSSVDVDMEPGKRNSILTSGSIINSDEILLKTDQKYSSENEESTTCSPKPKSSCGVHQQTEIHSEGNILTYEEHSEILTSQL
jgi:hypothetical protein